MTSSGMVEIYCWIVEAGMIQASSDIVITLMNMVMNLHTETGVLFQVDCELAWYDICEIKCQLVEHTIGYKY